MKAEEWAALAASCLLGIIMGAVLLTEGFIINARSDWMAGGLITLLNGFGFMLFTAKAVEKLVETLKGKGK